jgi:hypothetical protein
MHKLAIALLVSAVLATSPLAQTKQETGKDAANKVAIPTNTFFSTLSASSLSEPKSSTRMAKLSARSAT